MHETFFTVPSPIDVVNAGQTTLCAPGTKVAARRQDKVMQPVGGIGIILAHAVVHQDRQTERVAEQNARINHPIVACPQRLLQPAQDVSAASVHRAVVQHPHARGFSPVAKTGRQNGRHHPMLPGMPLNGPTTFDVIQPP